MAVIADRPVEADNFIKHCEQRRKYPVLLRVEFQVNLHIHRPHLHISIIYNHRSRHYIINIVITLLKIIKFILKS